MVGLPVKSLCVSYFIKINSENNLKVEIVLNRKTKQCI